MRRVRRIHEASSSRQRWLIGILLIGLFGGAGADLVRTAAAQPQRSQVQTDDGEVPGSRGAKPPAELNQIDDKPVQMTPARPPEPPKPVITCCTPGKDCPCTPGVDCPCTGPNCACTPGVNCACTPGVNCPARAPQRSDFCIKGQNCPCTPGKDCDRCIPGKTCACTPYIDCPSDDGVLFAKDSADIMPATRDKLVKFVPVFIKQHPLVVVAPSDLVGLGPEARENKRQADTRIRVEGHVADDEMSRVYPQQVSLAIQRANAVKRALIEIGLPEAYIADARGYGPVCKVKIRPEEQDRNSAVEFVFDNDRTGCAFPESSLRPPIVPDLPPKGAGKSKPGAKPAGNKPAAKPVGGAKPAGTK